MTDTENENKEASSTVLEFEKARKNAQKAGRCISAAIFVIVTVNVLIMVLSTRGFFKQEIPTLSTKVAKKLEVVVRNHGPELERVARRLIPVYLNAFQTVIDRDFPLMEQELAATFEKLEQHASNNQPIVQQAMTSLVESRKDDFILALEGVVGRKIPPKELEFIGRSYNEALLRKLDRAWHRTFKQYEHVVTELEGNLQVLTRAEPDLNRKIEIEEAVGILLELAGVELQKESYS